MRHIHLLTLPCLLTLASACGDAKPPARAAPEPFVRKTPAGLEIVELDVENGAAGTLPGTTSAGTHVARIARAGDRMMVTTASDSGGPYAAYALDRASRTWRDLEIPTFAPTYSSDLGIVVMNGYTDERTRVRTVKLVTYEGRTLFKLDDTDTDERYPRLEAISPTGQWFALRAGPQTVDVHEIAADGTVGPARSIRKAEPADNYTKTIRCTLPTTMVVDEDARSSSWLDSSLAPVAVPAFAGTTDAIPYELLQDRCSYQVTTGHAHDVYRFTDRSLTKLFSFGGDARLLAVGDGVHLRQESATTFALADSSGAWTALYTPLAMAQRTFGEPSPYVSVLATSLSASTKAVLFSVEYDVVDAGGPQDVELGEQLFVVSASGAAAPPVRLRAVAPPTSPSAPGSQHPAYRFTRDGTKLLYVQDGRIHVRALSAPSVDQVLDGESFEDAEVKDPPP